MLYALSGNGVGSRSTVTVSSLWTIDTATGAATLATTLATPVSSDISFLNGTLYGFSGSGFDVLSTIDPVTGTVTAGGSSVPAQGFAANPNQSVFYSDGVAGADFNIIQPDGSFSHIGGSGANGGGDVDLDLAYDAADDILYAWDWRFDGLDIIDRTSGKVTSVSTDVFGAFNISGDVAYDGFNHTLYAITRGNQSTIGLYTLDVNTGLPTLVGSTGLSRTTNFFGFADLQPAAAPEPSTGGSIGLALAAGLALRRRFRHSPEPPK